MAGTADAHPDDVLAFWLNEVGPKGWFAATSAVDDAVRSRFSGLWRVAADGGISDWADTARGALAYLIVTDQFPRNMFRGKPDAFTTDALAREVARAALDAGFDRQIAGDERQFFYMPFGHSEETGDQELAVALIAARLGAEEHVLHARAHREVIRRFGRFPFRNAVLGRVNTAAEQAFLDAGAYPALVRQMREAMQSTHGSPVKPPS